MERREVLVCLDLLDHQVSLDPEVNLALMETLDHLDRKVLADSLVPWDQKVTLEAREVMESRGQEVFLVQPEMQEREVQEASEAKLDPRDLLENQAHLVVVECLVLMGQWDPRVNQETEVCRESKVQRVSLEI